jgi:hypothetical protein
MTNQQKIMLIQCVLGVDADGIIGPKTKTAFAALSGVNSGKASWYSQYEGEYSWVDKEDKPNSNALGVPDDQQGIALPDRATLGQYFNVTAPNGVTLELRQTDIGPATWTGRKIDIAAVAAEAFGYSPDTFPTNKIFTWSPA